MNTAINILIIVLLIPFLLFLILWFYVYATAGKMKEKCDTCRPTGTGSTAGQAEQFVGTLSQSDYILNPYKPPYNAISSVAQTPEFLGGNGYFDKASITDHQSLTE